MNGKPTKRTMHTLGSNVPQVIALRTKKELPDYRKQVILTKRIIPERETTVVLTVSWRIPSASKYQHFLAYMPILKVRGD
jgi:hypothetical protein